MTKSDIIPWRWRHTNIFWHRWSSLINGLPHRLTTAWPSLATAPAYNTVAVSRDHADLQCRGRTCLDELFIDYEQVTTWEARFLFQQIGGKLSYIINRHLHWVVQWVGAQVAATTVWLTSNHQLEGTIGRVADTAHTGSFITRRSHLNLLWIYIVLSTPMIYKVMSLYIMVKYEEFQANSSSHLETRGLR